MGLVCTPEALSVFLNDPQQSLMNEGEPSSLYFSDVAAYSILQSPGSKTSIPALIRALNVMRKDFGKSYSHTFVNDDMQEFRRVEKASSRALQMVVSKATEMLQSYFTDNPSDSDRSRFQFLLITTLSEEMKSHAILEMAREKALTGPIKPLDQLDLLFLSMCRFRNESILCPITDRFDHDDYWVTTRLTCEFLKIDIQFMNPKV